MVEVRIRTGVEALVREGVPSARIDQKGQDVGGRGRRMNHNVGTVHHIELWVPDLERAAAQWGWVLTALCYEAFQQWTHGRSWRHGDTYVVVEQSPALSTGEHDRCRPGMNHLALHAGDRADVDALAADAPAHGWRLMYADTHPHAGGDDHYAAYLTNSDGYEVELVATN